MRFFITSQFSYYPLTWMFHSRNLNNKMNPFSTNVPLLYPLKTSGGIEAEHWLKIG